ncbi:MAG: ATP-dependent sacrificial sulfur transferase LarE [Chthoniobacteraceae bacterium]|jgi:uncharacterized protein
MDTTAAKAERLKQLLAEHAPLVIAYSGGVDSAYLLAAAHEALGDRALGVIADSASLPRESLAEALETARQIGARVEVVETGELDDPRYASNPVNRCYFCKAELFTKLDALARQRGYAAIAYGENVDDMSQVRPGRAAAEQFQVLAPLREAGLNKAEIRQLSRELGLPTADAPAQPCLSSRIPHGTPVTVEALAMIERGEALVRSLGFKVFRVRHLELERQTRARVQIAPEEMGRIELVNELLVSGLRAVGYDDVEIDPAGYRPPGASELVPYRQ